MAICKKKIFEYFVFILIIILTSTNLAFAGSNFEKLEKKNVSFLDFFLLKLENRIIRNSQFLRRQMIATRVQYSSVGIQVDFDKKEESIFIDIYTVMDKRRYTKKKYIQKLSDCNQVRNIVFYKRHGYKFFSQKRDPNLSEEVMEDIFKETFFNNISFSEDEKNFLLKNMHVKVTIFHPITKKELVCSGKVNDYELN